MSRENDARDDASRGGSPPARTSHGAVASSARPLSRGALLVAAAALVLAEASPLEEFRAWLRFFVDEWGARP